MVKSRARFIIAGLTMTCAWPALAQTQSPGSVSAVPANDAGAAGEIIVTAQKRRDRAQDVPISLGVLRGDQIARAGITNVTQLATQFPNVSMTAPYGDTQPAFIIRGITMSDYAMNQQSPIALYVDEVYKGVAALQSMQLFDLERVEVLRGPQGTLYGKNATGGAVSFYTRAPSFDGTNGYISLGYGNYNRKQIEGAVNAAVTGNLAIRLAGLYEKADGWGHELYIPDTGSKDNYAFRASIRYRPSSATDIILRGTISRTRSSGISDFSVNGPEGVFLSGTPPYSRPNIGFYDGVKGDPSDLHSSAKGASLTVKSDLSDTLALTSISSYDYGSLYNQEDADNTPLQIANLTDTSNVRAYSQDIRLAKTTSTFKLMLGAYYNHEKVRYSERDEWLFQYATYNPATGASSCAVDDFTGCRWVDDLEQIKDSVAVYGNGSYQIAQGLEFAGGVRFTHDLARLPSYQAYYDFHDEATGTELQRAIVTITQSPIQRVVDNNVSYKIGLNYKPARDLLLYTSFSTGYRGSSFNGLAFNSPDQITAAKPEKVYALEIGEKYQFLERRLTLNSSLFHYIYKNQQALGESGTASIQTLFNAPEAEIWGGEFDIVAQPVPAVRLSLGGGYTDGTYDEGIINGVEVGGHQLIGSAKLTLNGAASFTPLDNGDHRLTINADTDYTSRRYFDIFQTEAVSQPGFWLVNGNVGFEFKKQRIEVSAWGRNLLGQHYVVGAQDLRSFTNQVFYSRGEPRTYGVKAKLTF